MRAEKRFLIFHIALILSGLASAAFGQPPQAPRNGWAPFGPGGGTPQGLAVDSRNPAVIYAAEGTLYRSADAGATWTRLVGAQFTAVALDAAHPRTIYAGGGQIARSVDSGKTWQITFPSQAEVTGFAVIPGQPSVILAASGPQLLRSADGGSTWSATLVNSHLGSVAVDPGSPRTAYYTDELGVYKSTDAGKTWKLLAGPSENGEPVPFGSLALARGVIYLHAGDGIYRSDDGGRSWQRAGNAPWQKLLDAAFLADPSAPEKLYLAGPGGIYGSTDGGRIWSPLDGGLPRLPFNATLPFYSLVLSPGRRGVLYAGAEQRGVAKSLDGGANWHIGLEPGLSGGPVALLKVHPSRPDTIYVGLAGGGDRAFFTTDGGQTWKGFNRRIARDGLLDLAFDPDDPDRLYAANGNGLWESRDSGGTWARRDPSAFRRIAVATPGTLIAARGCGLSRSTDDGQTWTTVIPCVPPSGDDFTVSASGLWVDPDSPRNLYALMQGDDGQGHFDRFLAASTDDGVTWNPLPFAPSVVAVAPSDFRTLYGLDFETGRILRSRDGGESWQVAHEPSATLSTFGTLAVDATDPDTLYVGTYQSGILRSRDGGVTLKPIGALFDPTRQPIGFLATFRAQPGILYATVFDGGLYRGQFE
jgi:photosystem II stability/assembly factor-like uncharacterized protein